MLSKIFKTYNNNLINRDKIETLFHSNTKRIKKSNLMLSATNELPIPRTHYQ